MAVWQGVICYQYVERDGTSIPIVYKCPACGVVRKDNYTVGDSTIVECSLCGAKVGLNSLDSKAYKVLAQCESQSN